MCFTDDHKGSDAALPAVCPFAQIYMFFRDIYKQREKSARRQGHPCLRFFYDFVSVVSPNFRSFVTPTSSSARFLTRSYTCSFVTFTSSGRLQQREKLGRWQGHPRLRFVHDSESAVLKTRNSCGFVSGTILA